MRAAWAMAASSPRPASTQIVIWSTVFGNARSIAVAALRRLDVHDDVDDEEADAGEEHADEERERRSGSGRNTQQAEQQAGDAEHAP